jgi:CheY-like chemotaxis protein
MNLNPTFIGAQMIFPCLPKCGDERLIAPLPEWTVDMSASSQLPRGRNVPPLIFIVDDKPELTQMAEMILLAEGYQCQLFCDPKQVLKIFETSAVRPDLLLTDYEMGSMNGLELIEHCRFASPDLKAVLVSGTVQASTVFQHPVKVNQFLSKPYRAKDLAALVKSLLAE